MRSCEVTLGNVHRHQAMTRARRAAAALLAALFGAACAPDPAPRAAAPPSSPALPASTLTATASAAPGGEAAAAPAANGGLCPDDMVEIQGDYCTRVNEVCLKRRKPRQCAEFQAPSVCEGPTQPKHYCIDR